MLSPTVLTRRANRVRCLEAIVAALGAASGGLGTASLLDKLLPDLAEAIGATTLRVDLESTASRVSRRGAGARRPARTDAHECVRPLTAAGRSFGTLYARYPAAGPAPDDEALLTLVAHVVAVVMDSAGLHERDRRGRKRLGDFVGMLAHELRTPLAAIASAMDVLARPALAPAALLRARELVERQVRYQARLLDDLLDVTRIARDTIELRHTPVDLKNVVAAAVEVTMPSITHRRQALTVSLPADSVSIVGDGVRLQQVVVNLMANATKFTPVGGRIAVTVEQTEDGPMLRVADSGDGISAEMLPRVFDPFVQAPRRDGAPRSGGLGVGLAVVKRLVEAHGGAVEARSAGRGLGSEFIVRLPSADDATGAPGTATPPEPGTRWGAGAVLIVADDIDTRVGLQAALERAGRTAVVAATGREGLEQAADLRPQLMLVDLALRDMSGDEIARLARATLGGGVILIALSGAGGADERRRARSVGFDAHLLKPVTIDQIAFVVARCRHRTDVA
jgi:signal transduction histidine kinase/CheY-like chemotaxis protein